MDKVSLWNGREDHLKIRSLSHHVIAQMIFRLWQSGNIELLKLLYYLSDYKVLSFSSLIKKAHSRTAFITAHSSLFFREDTIKRRGAGKVDQTMSST